MKRKTLAILLSVLLVVSAVLVLTACQTKEYTVKFRNYNSSQMGDPVKTVNGKATFTRTDLLEADDRVFDGWYDSLNIGADGTMTYGKKVDLETATFTQDTTLYAKWTLIGESVGYCIPGVINGVTDWNLVTVVTNEARKLTHENGTNVYTMTDLTLKQGDSFKVVSAVAAATGQWDGNVKIQAGYSQLTVKVAADATLPDDYSGDTEELVGSGDMNNISILYDMVIDLRFEYAATSEDCVVTITVKSASGEALADITDVGYIIVGSVSSWNGPFAAGGPYADFIMTPNAEKTIYTATISINPGSFKIKVNEADWNRGNYGSGALMKVTVANTVTLPEGITEENLDEIFGGDNDGNITCAYIITATITLDLTGATGAIEINVTELEEVTETHQMFIMGTIGGGNFDQAYDDESTIKLTKKDNSTTWTGRITITEADYGPAWTASEGPFETVCAVVKVKNNVDSKDYGGNKFLLAGEYMVSYNEEDNSVSYEEMGYYVVGTFVDAEDHNQNYTVVIGLTPKMTVSQDGTTATVTLTVTDVSERDGYTWLGENVFGLQPVYGTSLGVETWFGSGYQISAVGEYTITLDIAAGTFTVAPAEAEA